MLLPVINTSSRHVEHGAMFPVENRFYVSDQHIASSFGVVGKELFLLPATYWFLLCLLFAIFYRVAPLECG